MPYDILKLEFYFGCKEGADIKYIHHRVKSTGEPESGRSGKLRRRMAAAAAAVILALLAVSACEYKPISDQAYQTLASSIQNDIMQLLPTAVPQDGDFAADGSGKVNEIGSRQDLFFVLQDALYNFDDEVYISIEKYDLFSSYWAELSNEGALHSAYETSEVKVEYDNKTPCTIRLMFEYNAAGKILKALKNGELMEFADADAARLYKKATDILAQIITPDMTDTQKEIAIHDYIVKHTKYSTDGDQEHLATAESVLLEGAGQCQGYSEAFGLLLELSGISTRIVSGSAAGSDGIYVAHAWNQVRINGVWYNADITWDDPVPDTGDYASRTYMNRSDDFMRADHKWSDLFQACEVDFPINPAEDSAETDIS